MAQTANTGPAAGRPEQVGSGLFHLVVTLLPALPLLADWAAVALGWHIFFLADSRIQSVFGTLVLATGTWPYLAGVLRRGATLTVRAGHGLALAGAGALYARGMYLTYGPAALGSHDLFQIAAAWLVGLSLLRLLLATSGTVTGADSEGDSRKT